MNMIKHSQFNSWNILQGSLLYSIQSICDWIGENVLNYTYQIKTNTTNEWLHFHTNTLVYTLSITQAGLNSCCVAGSNGCCEGPDYKRIVSELLIQVDCVIFTTYWQLRYQDGLIISSVDFNHHLWTSISIFDLPPLPPTPSWVLMILILFM